MARIGAPAGIPGAAPATTPVTTPDEQPTNVDLMRVQEAQVTFDGNEWTARRVYPASGLGGCQTALIARGMGLVPADMPEKLQPALDAGKENEPRILQMLERTPDFDARQHRITIQDEFLLKGVWRLYDAADYEKLNIETGEWDEERGVDYSGQPRVWLPIGTSAVVRAHPDGIGVKVVKGKVEQRRVVEVKAFGDELWDRWVRRGWAEFPGYAMQMSVQMYAAGASILKTPKSFMPGMFVVGHKNEEGVAFELSVLELDKPPVELKTILAKVMNVEKYVKREELPACVEGRWPCPFYWMAECAGKPRVEVEEIEDTELGGVAARFYAYGVDRKEADASRKDEQEKLVKLLEKHGKKESGKKVKVKDEARNVFVVEWREVEQPEKTSKAYTQKYAIVTLETP